ncbi:hypothetical protein IFM89_026781 [Coptis chinensis]|uniref:phosphatidylserine decarboxylase n=1 Tax=Coptis chinensis TaxID=261450 RepID=A0A835HMV3_9MAGN|nr:hypothetical protein IFM89_026781 [Coptis chinensis]
MKFQVYPKWAFIFTRNNHHRSLFSSSLNKPFKFQSSQASVNGGTNSSSEGTSFFVPGATVATILMLGALHARRLYNDKKMEEVREKGIEIEFSPDAKASFMRLLPLRSISRVWGFVTSTTDSLYYPFGASFAFLAVRKWKAERVLWSRVQACTSVDLGAISVIGYPAGFHKRKMGDMEFPVWLRPFIHKAWARAFHSNLEEIALPLDQYASLRDFFVRTLKEGSRPIDPDLHCLVSPVDGTIVRFGELKPGAMIEQIKGVSYSAVALLGTNSFLSVVDDNVHAENSEEKNTINDTSKKSWWRISLASPRVCDPTPVRPVKGVFYCVLYLKPGDYHRVHSPVNWNVSIRRHFPGRLYPTNERARRTIRNIYVENERIVLEGQWQEGLMALAAVGATNVGSIELFIEPELRTNRPHNLLHSEPPKEHLYAPEGVMLKKGEEVAAFNMGSTVVLVFQAPVCKSYEKDGTSSEFKFCVEQGDRIRVGEALGRWQITDKQPPQR